MQDRQQISYYCRSRHISEARQRREQSRAPSTSVKEVINIEDSPEKNQDSSNDDQVLHQTEKSLVPSYTLDEIFGNQEWPAEGNVDVQEPSWSNENRQDWFQRESSSTTNRIGDFLFGEDYPLTTEHFSNIQSLGYTSTTQEQWINDQDLPARAGSSSQVVQTDKTPRTREVIDIPDSPESSSSKKRPKKLLRVTVSSFSINDTPERKFPVEVNPSDNVEVLRIELEKMQQRSQLLLPEEGYFFIHKTQVLNEKQSFRWNRVDEGDIIAIFPGTVSDDNRTNTRT